MNRRHSVLIITLAVVGSMIMMFSLVSNRDKMSGDAEFMTMDFTLIPTVTLSAMMLALGMGLRLGDFTRLVKAPVTVVIGTLGQLVVMPAIAMGVVFLLSAPIEIGMGLMLLAACPGGATSNMLTNYANGDVALSISLTTLSSLVAPFYVPFLIGLSYALLLPNGTPTEYSAVAAGQTLFLSTTLPVILGMFLRWYFSERVVPVRRYLLAGSATLLVLLLIGLGYNTSQTQPDVMGMFVRSSAAVVLLIAGTVVAARVTARGLGRSRIEERTLVLELGVQNVNLALVMALTVLQTPAYLGPTLVYLPFMFALGAIVIVWGRKDGRAGARPVLRAGVASGVRCQRGCQINPPPSAADAVARRDPQ